MCSLKHFEVIFKGLGFVFKHFNMLQHMVLHSVMMSCLVLSMGSILSTNVGYNPWIFFILLKHVERSLRFFFKSYKKDKIANLDLKNDRHECKFYDSLDQ